MRLDMAVRLFTPADGENAPGPTIALAGAIHVAEPMFYQTLQTFLDSQDLVLFEGVKPRGMGERDEEKMTDAERAERTKRSIRFVAMMLHRVREAEGAYPASLDELRMTVSEFEGERLAGFLDSSLEDAWGRELEYDLTDEGQTFALVSYGADGEPGGEGVAADLHFADQAPLSDLETGTEPGMQRRLADALGLAFQLDAMRHDRPHFRNSDLSIDEIEKKTAEAGGDASFLFNVLDGSSFSAKIMNFMLGMIEKSDRLRAMTKATLLEAMRLVSEKGLSNMAGMPPEMESLLEVIIDQRNQVVVDDLRAILASEEFDRGDTIGVVYGAGHLDDLEKRIVEQLDYKPVGGFWIGAIEVDLAEAGMTMTQVRMIRTMLRGMSLQ